MIRLWNRLKGRFDPEWRLAIVLGLASIPFTVAFYWQSSPDFTHHFAPVFFAGVIGGTLAYSTGLKAGRVGARIGLVGSLVELWPFVDLLVFISGLNQPLGFSGLQGVMLVCFTLLVIGLSALAGKIGAILGHWTLERTDTYRSRLGAH
ncbi:hypothetical protein HALLA_07160 [Halostagnicola larsenii XH-48]|uniref:DUF5518 domain-containing protein n=1 Tax=Halostagnicola larsenii XH-48 TaxID=797299 RepID=W0JQC0_9EURY|nr:DUF5518 domain-containing protein [Halostagnicola larsenii]AHG00779.1 hypothetical protein HALLA_07160 [Halostagnicola larsenii XH-48]